MEIDLHVCDPVLTATQPLLTQSHLSSSALPGRLHYVYFGPFMSCLQVKKMVSRRSKIWRNFVPKLNPNSNAVERATILTIFISGV